LTPAVTVSILQTHGTHEDRGDHGVVDGNGLPVRWG
jgi:hypothetical protein